MGTVDVAGDRVVDRIRRAREGKADPLAKPEKAAKAVAAEQPAAVGEQPAEGEAGEFTFAGRKWKTQADAERYFHSVNGRQKELTEARKTQTAAVQIANQWEGYANTEIGRRNVGITKLAAEVKRLGGDPQVILGELQAFVQPGQAAPESPASQQQPASAGTKSFVEGLMTDGTFQQIAKTHGEGTALLWAMDKFAQGQQQDPGKLREQLRQEILSEIGPVIEPFQRQQQEAAASQAAGEFWTKVVQGAANDDGSLMFPELNNPKAISEVAELWRRQGKAYADADIEQSVHTAILQWRDMDARRRQKSGGAGRTAENVVNTLEQARNSQGTAAVVSGGSPAPRPAPPPAKGDLGWLQRMRSAPGSTDRVTGTGLKLGFSRV